jgi:hypothetical protein
MRVTISPSTFDWKHSTVKPRFCARSVRVRSISSRVVEP